MKTTSIFLLFCLLHFQNAGAQIPALDSLQTERLVKLSQLWGHVHFFHPYLAYKEIPWDSSFAEAVPKFIAAKDAEAYSQALDQLLSVLGDPLTNVVKNENSSPGEFSAGEKHPLWHFTEDSILVVTLHNYYDLSDWNYAVEKFSKIAKMVPASKGVLFDWRVKKPFSDATWVINYAFSSTGLESKLTDATLQAPGQRARMHDGFAPENGSTSGGYYSAFYVQDGQRIAPAAKAKPVPVVFLVNDETPLPPVAVALQGAGKGGIVASGTINAAALGQAIPMDMGEGVTARFRTTEVLTASGLTGLPINFSLPENSTDWEALDAALRYLKKGEFSMPPANSPPPMVGSAFTQKYPTKAYPDLGYRVLAAAKIWSVIHYFFAYKELMEADWNEVLRTSIPKLVAAADSTAYHLAVAEMYSHLQDGHGFLNSKTLSDYFGAGYPPFALRMVENQPVITALTVDSVTHSLGLEIGDVVTHVNGKTVQSELARHERYISGSNANWIHAQAAARLLRGPDSTQVEVKLMGKNNRSKTVSIPLRKAWSSLWWEGISGRKGTEILRMLNGNIGYADLDRLSPEQVDTMFEMFKDTKAIIFDMRGYPQGTAWSIAPRLTEKKNVGAADFQRYVRLSPDLISLDLGASFTKNHFTQNIPNSDKWKYKGKTVMLIDERTMSQAEHSGLFYESANGTEFIGSQTAGANGDVTSFSVPGGIRLAFSGHDVRHADGRQLQKTGLVPKIEVRPTVAGIRAGKDEVLERAILYLTNKN